MPDPSEGISDAVKIVWTQEMTDKLTAAEATIAELTRERDEHEQSQVRWMAIALEFRQRIADLEGALKPFVDYWTHDEDYDDEVYERPNADQYDALVAAALSTEEKT